MLRALGAIVFAVLAYTVLMLAAGHLPPSYASGAAFLAPLIGSPRRGGPSVTPK